MELGTRIAHYRQLAGMNQSELARKFDPPLTPQTVQAWEKGGGIRPAKFEALAEALGISLGQLLLGDEYADRSQPARLDPTIVTRTMEALLVFMRRRNPDATLDLTNPGDAEVFAAVYQAAAASPATSSGSLELGAIVADLVTARWGDDGQRNEPTGGAARGKTRKASAGA